MDWCAACRLMASETPSQAPSRSATSCLGAAASAGAQSLSRRTSLELPKFLRKVISLAHGRQSTSSMWEWQGHWGISMGRTLLEHQRMNPWRTASRRALTPVSQYIRCHRQESPRKRHYPRCATGSHVAGQPGRASRSSDGHSSPHRPEPRTVRALLRHRIPYGPAAAPSATAENRTRCTAIGAELPLPEDAGPAQILMNRSN